MRRRLAAGLSAIFGDGQDDFDYGELGGRRHVKSGQKG